MKFQAFKLILFISLPIFSFNVYSKQLPQEISETIFTFKKMKKISKATWFQKYKYSRHYLIFKLGTNHKYTKFSLTGLNKKIKVARYYKSKKSSFPLFNKVENPKLKNVFTGNTIVLALSDGRSFTTFSRERLDKKLPVFSFYLNLFDAKNKKSSKKINLKISEEPSSVKYKDSYISKW